MQLRSVIPTKDWTRLSYSKIPRRFQKYWEFSGEVALDFLQAVEDRTSMELL